jgi:NOL1/NOP2/fmu family ribosome biogenesis protein
MAFLQRYADLLQFCLKRLNVLHFGVPLVEPKGKDLIPQAGLALSKALNVQNFATAEVDLSAALSFLRCEAINLPDAPRGFLLLTHQNLPIGWVKNIGNRCNNFYPQPWRIRHL